MNWTLFKATLKSNRILWLVMASVLYMYTSVMTYMFDPENASAMAEMIDMLPESFGRAFGFDELALTLTSHMGQYLYGFIYLVFPMIFVILTAHGLIAKHVDRGSMSYLLSTPNTRRNIVATQAIYMLVSVTALFVVETILGIFTARAFFGDMLDIGTYIEFNLITLSMFFVVSGISFLASVFFNEARYSMAVGMGVPIAFFIIKVLWGAAPKLDFLKYFTVFSLMKPAEILGNSNYTYVTSAWLILAAVAIYTAAIVIFEKRSMIV